MNEPVDPERNRRAAVWLAILSAGLILTVCYALAATVGLMAVYPPARTLVYGLGATEAPTPLPGARPTRPATATAARPDAPSEIVVQAGIMGGAPTLYDFAPAWQALTAPGMNNLNITFAYDQPVALYTGWCASTQQILDENFRHITYLLQIDFESIPVEELAWLDEAGNGGVCRSYSGFVPAWPPGAHTVVMTMRLGQAINDGWSDYPAGDYVDRFNISVTR